MSETINNSTSTGKSTLQQICAPAVIYLIFSLVQIVIDLFKGLYNQAFFKFLVMIIFTLLLNALCARGLGVISWMLVMVPFILMSLITAILLFVFGLDPSTGQMTYNNNQSTKQVETKYVYIDPRQQQIYEDKDYDPNDYYSGTPDEINHYNNNTSNTNKNEVGTDCASKNMKTCGSTGPNVCYKMDDVCPGVGSEQPQAAQTSSTKTGSKQSVPGVYDPVNPSDSSTPSTVKKDEKFYGSNDPNDPYLPVPKMLDGPRTAAAYELTRPKYTNRPNRQEGGTSQSSYDSMNRFSKGTTKPPPPETTTVEKFIENMNLSFRF